MLKGMCPAAHGPALHRIEDAHPAMLAGWVDARGGCDVSAWRALTK